MSNRKRDVKIYTKVRCKLADRILLLIVSTYVYTCIYLHTYISAAYFWHCSMISTYYMPHMLHTGIHCKYHAPYHEIAYRVCIVERYVRISIHTYSHVAYTYCKVLYHIFPSNARIICNPRTHIQYDLDS